jgi:hypothetical protein
VQIKTRLVGVPHRDDGTLGRPAALAGTGEGDEARGPGPPARAVHVLRQPGGLAAAEVLAGVAESLKVQHHQARMVITKSWPTDTTRSAAPGGGLSASAAQTRPERQIAAAATPANRRPQRVLDAKPEVLIEDSTQVSDSREKKLTATGKGSRN